MTVLSIQIAILRFVVFAKTKGLKMSAEKKKRSARKPRGSWGAVNPVQKPHSTPKGKHGYTRAEDKKGIEEAVDDLYEDAGVPSDSSPK